MKWLHLSSGNLYGGIETQLLTQAQFRHSCPHYLQEYGLCFSGRLSNALAETGVAVHQLGSVRVSRPWTVVAARARLGRLLRDRNYDGVVSHGPWPHGLFASTVKAARLPIVFFAHNAYAGKHWTERWAKLTRPDAVVFNSEFTAKTMSTFWPGVSEEVIRCPVTAPSDQTDEDKVAVRAEFATPSTALVVVQAARMESWKGHEATMRAFAAANVAGAMLWLAGGAQRPSEQQYLNSLHTLAQKLRIAEKVRFIGDRADISRVLAAADIYCQPNSEPEAFGISFIEALYAGLPVLSYNAGGPKEIITERCGILVEERNEEYLLEAMKKLLISTELRLDMATSARNRARELCNPSVQLARQENTFRKCLEVAGDIIK